MSVSRITSLAEFAAAVPYFVGYHPADALTMVTMREGRVIFTAVWRECATGLAADPGGLINAAQRATEAGATSAALFCFDAGHDEAARRLALVAAACEVAGMEVLSRSVIEGGAMLDLGNPESVWQEVPPPPIDVAAQYAMAGVVPVDSREALARSFQSGETDEVAAALRTGVYDLADGIAAWSRILDEDAAVQEMPAKEIAAAVSMLDHTPSLRDGVFWRIIPGTPDAVADVLTDTQREAIESLPTASRSTARAITTADRLRQVCTRVPNEHAAGLLTAAGALYWWAGDGARADIALTRVLDAHPDYRLAQIMSQMVGHGIRLQVMETTG